MYYLFCILFCVFIRVHMFASSFLFSAIILEQLLDELSERWVSLENTLDEHSESTNPVISLLLSLADEIQRPLCGNDGE